MDTLNSMVMGGSVVYNWFFLIFLVITIESVNPGDFVSLEC